MLNIVFFSEARALLVLLDIPAAEEPGATLVRLRELLKVNGYDDPPVSFASLAPDAACVIGEVETVSLHDLTNGETPEDATGDVWSPALSPALTLLVDEAERAAFPEDFDDESDS